MKINYFRNEYKRGNSSANINNAINDTGTLLFVFGGLSYVFSGIGILYRYFFTLNFPH
jgi:hypothetical protein